jgi:hypothetical protein
MMKKSYEELWRKRRKKQRKMIAQVVFALENKDKKMVKCSDFWTKEKHKEKGHTSVVCGLRRVSSAC